MNGIEKNSIPPHAMPRGSVLLVDDVETNFLIAKALLKPYRLRIETAASGSLAIDMVKAGKVYDVVFMDHLMPEMNGIEAVKIMRGLGYAAPIIALTSGAGSAQEQESLFLQNGFDGFISKPIDTRQLDGVLTKYIRGAQPAEALERNNSAGERAADPKTDPVLAESFIRDAKRAAAVLEEFCRKADYGDESLKRHTVAVHGIKTPLRNIGETELADTAHLLEKARLEGNTALIVSQTPTFLKNLCALIEKIASSIGQGHQEETDSDPREMRDRMSEIQKACADYNRKGALDIIAGIKGCSKETRALLDRIKEKVMYSDFDEAEKEAASYNPA